MAHQVTSSFPIPFFSSCRLLFAVREEAGDSSPPMRRRSSFRDAINAVSSAVKNAMSRKKVGGSSIFTVPQLHHLRSYSPLLISLSRRFALAQTDIIQKLTKHLNKADHGEHWPPELDFELTGK